MLTIYIDNAFSQIFGLMLILPGILILANVEYINENVKPLMKTLSYGDVNLADVADGLSISMIILGIFILVVAMLGLCGTCKSNKKCLCIVSILSYIKTTE